MSSRQLLLPLLRAGLDARDAPPALLSQGDQGKEVVALAARWSLSFQLLQAAGPSGADVLSSDCVKELVAQIRHTAVRNASQHRRLQQLLDECSREGIPVILVKGLWLVHCVYRDAAARESGDIDLLLHPEDIPRFLQLAGGLGCDVPGDGARLLADAHRTNEFGLRHPDGGPLVDVHWSLTSPVREAPVDEELLWERSEEVDVGGVRCRTLNLEDHLLYLCFHAAVHHRFQGLGPRCLYDVAMVIRNPPRAVRWEDLLERAHALGWQRAAWLVFALVHEQLGVEAPASVMQDLLRDSAEDREMLGVALKELFSGRRRTGLYWQVAHIRALGSSARRLAAVRQLFFPSRVLLDNQFGVSPAPTWLLHVKRWAINMVDWPPEVWALLARGRNRREEVARIRQIERWVAGT